MMSNSDARKRLAEREQVAHSAEKDAICACSDPGWTHAPDLHEWAAEVDRNARAYGWEVGNGHPLAEQIESTDPANPFLARDWRTRITSPEPHHPLADECVKSDCEEIHYARRLPSILPPGGSS